MELEIYKTALRLAVTKIVNLQAIDYFEKDNEFDKTHKQLLDQAECICKIIYKKD